MEALAYTLRFASPSVAGCAGSCSFTKSSSFTLGDYLRETGQEWHVDKDRPEVRNGYALFGGAPKREKGWITKDVLERHLAPPGEDSLTLVCGLPRVYETLCGPRGDPEVAGTLAALGWSRRDVVKL